MKKGNILFVRTDYKNENLEVTKIDFDDHINYLKDIADKRYFMGGGFVDVPGGMIIFEAENIEEAHEIARKDPLIERSLYTYEIKEWELGIVSKESI